MSLSDDSDHELEENYYTFLNLPRNATQDQINSSYRKLSRIYHPDKHTEVENKKNAEVLFNRTKRAYEVLSDPQKRAVYDSIGEKGLRTDGWEVIHRTKTPAEIREEYERLAEAAEARKLQQSTNPRGNVTININATEIFSPYDEDEFPNIEVSSMSISQSIEAPLTRKDTLVMSGNLYSGNGNGTGNFVVCGRRLFNKGWLEMDVGAGNGPIVGIKAGRNLTSTIKLMGGSSVNFRENGVVPAIFSSLAVQLDKHTVGTLVVNVGNQPSLVTQVDRSTEQHAWSTSIVIGVPNIYFSLAYTRKLPEHDLKLRCAAKVGTFGFMAEYGAEKKVSKYSSVLAAVSVGVPTGVILKFKITRSSQTYIMPIHLSEEIIPASVFYATVVPFIGWFVLKKTIIDPMLEDRRKSELEKTKRNFEQKLAERQQEAEIAISLMHRTYERSVQEERERDGLIILKATYSAVVSEVGASDVEENTSHDVTVPLQCLVKDGSLNLYSSSKSELPGFYDVCLGKEKTLKVDYQFKNETKTVCIKDEDALQLP